MRCFCEPGWHVLRCPGAKFSQASCRRQFVAREEVAPGEVEFFIDSCRDTAREADPWIDEEAIVAGRGNRGWRGNGGGATTEEQSGGERGKKRQLFQAGSLMSRIASSNIESGFVASSHCTFRSDLSQVICRFA